MSTSELLDYRKLSKILGRSEVTLRIDVMHRRIPFLKIGKLVRFDPQEISKWLDSKRVPAQGGQNG